MAIDNDCMRIEWYVGSHFAHFAVWKSLALSNDRVLYIGYIDPRVKAGIINQRKKYLHYAV